jgi:predicted helicase
VNISEYLDEVRKVYATGQASEHSYRPAIQKLFASIDPTLTVINEPKKSEAGMPDFIFQRGVVPVGWTECKDVDKDVLRLKGYSIEQRKRYEKAFPNLIYTNGVDFEFIREGEPVHFVSIADFMGQLGGLKPLPDKFDELERQLKLFAEQKPISIRSAAKLAKIMAAKAAIIKDEIGIALREDPEFRSALGIQFKSFKANLLPNLEPDEFADLYAETITYGMFAARFHDDDLSTFSRQEAMEDLPASNPFLKGLFQYIAGPSLPKRLEYIVDDLVQVMRASDPHSLFKDYGKWDARNDPFIHFYEDFLKEYNPAKRKSRGVYYTPEPVVNFIVRAVDDVLKTEFGIADGLADTSKVTVDWDTGSNDSKGKAILQKRQVHRVQILDPATGTGTFLAEVVRMIAERVKDRAPGKWSAYIEEDLLPRLHGFELLMASYAMCHMKIDMMLGQTGYKPRANPPRISVWLTNSLEPADRNVRDLFMPELVEEARGASEVKRQTPIMCVIGNPPYAISSSNQGDWITALIDEYKAGLNEQNVQPLSDDYIKFIRLAQNIVKTNRIGLIGFITNNAYIDGLIQKNLRRSLLRTFDKIYIFDLHGSTKRREKTPEGAPDRNVFDIQQGVCIAILIKTGESSTCEVFHRDIFGTREAKNSALFEARLADDSFKRACPHSPTYYLVPKDFASKEVYEQGFSVEGLFPNRGTGVKFRKDPLLISRNLSRGDVQEMISAMAVKSSSEILSTYGFSETKDWKVEDQRQNFANADDADIRAVDYRPFDTHYAYYPFDRISQIIPRGDSRRGLMRHLTGKSNAALVLGRQGQVTGNEPWNLGFVACEIVDQNIFYRGGGLVCPVYLYPDPSDSQTDAFASPSHPQPRPQALR